MVKVNFSKLAQLIDATNNCPVGIPNRITKLFEMYEKACSTSDYEVSVHVSANLERLIEKNLDSEEKQRKMAIFSEIIENIQDLSLPCCNESKIYLISPLETCNNCGADSLITVRPSSHGSEGIVYTRAGSRVAEVYHKHCRQCLATLYTCYTEFGEEKSLTRRYLPLCDIKYFSITMKTFFDVKLLEELTEDIFTADCRITSFVEKYNRINTSSIELNKKRIFSSWLIFSISKRLLHCTEYPVIRDKDRNLNVEAVCSVLYPSLRKHVDAKWLKHICMKCEKRTLVMDGAAKVYRNVCAAKPEKIISRGELNQFRACSNSPVPGDIFCNNHKNNKSGEPDERLDVRITRAKRRELGIDVDFLTTTEGCRKRENVNVRTQRSKTAGMLYAYRPCGIAVGHLECIHAETCTDFILLLIEIFGKAPGKDDLTGVAIDRACDVHPYLTRIGNEGSQVVFSFLFSSI